MKITAEDFVRKDELFARIRETNDHEIDLSYGKLGLARTHDIIEFFKGVPECVTTLNLAHNDLSNKDFVVLMDILNSIPKHIIKLSLRGNNLAKFGNYCPGVIDSVGSNISDLDLSDNFSFMAVEYLASSLAQLKTTVTKLNLSRNSFWFYKSSQEYQTIFAAFKEALRELDISDNYTIAKLNARDLGSGFEVLKSNLQKLNLAKNGFGMNMDLNILLKIITARQTLEVVNLSGNRLSCYNFTLYDPKVSPLKIKFNTLLSKIPENIKVIIKNDDFDLIQQIPQVQKFKTRYSCLDDQQSQRLYECRGLYKTLFFTRSLAKQSHCHRAVAASIFQTFTQSKLSLKEQQDLLQKFNANVDKNVALIKSLTK